MSGPLAHVNLARGFRGGERQTELLIRGLAALGWAQRLVARRGAPLAARCRDVPGLEIAEVGFGVPGALLALRGAGLVHSHEGRGVQAAWLNRVIRGVPYVITRRVQKGPGDSALNRRIYRSAAVVVAISEAVRAALARLDARLPVTVIPSASSGLPVRLGNVERLRASFGGAFVAGHVGTLDDSAKGQLQIIGLARRWQAARPGVRFVLVGAGRDEGRLRQAAGGLDNVIFTGEVSNVGDYLAAFDLFMFPSRHEGLGSILLDALETGLPVVATAVGGIPEIIHDGENGLLVKPDDAAALEAAVAAFVADDGLRARVATANRLRAREFSAATMTGRYERLYRDVAARQNAAVILP
ncbi:MAG: glycosyltransferase family 4 protein [Gammaproteobacteria bacterium]|nr:glycosyltransferase family 4 protein [Gammaproteobacteria bacterium]